MSSSHDNEKNFAPYGERTPQPSAALSDYLVLDLTRVRSGPTCVRQLADWGANVIKIEAPSYTSEMGGPRAGLYFQSLHRSKPSLTLNGKSKKGRQAFMKTKTKFCWQITAKPRQ